VQLLSLRRDQERIDSLRRYPDQDEVDRVWVAFETPEVPGLGSASRVPRARAVSPAPGHAGIEARDGFLRNKYVAIEVSPTGVLSLADRGTGERYDGLAELEDEVDRGDTYTFSAGPAPRVRTGTALSSTVIAAGPLVGAIETWWSMRSAGGGSMNARLLVVLRADS